MSLQGTRSLHLYELDYQFCCRYVNGGYPPFGGSKFLLFDDAFSDGQICFAKSSSIYPIQLADFAAFSLNRVQLIGGRDQRSSLDKRLLEILSSFAFNYVNIEKEIVPVDQEGPLFTLADTRPNGPYPPKPS